MHSTAHMHKSGKKQKNLRLRFSTAPPNVPWTNIIHHLSFSVQFGPLETNSREKIRSQCPLISTSQKLQLLNLNCTLIWWFVEQRVQKVSLKIWLGCKMNVKLLMSKTKTCWARCAGAPDYWSFVCPPPKYIYIYIKKQRFVSYESSGNIRCKSGWNWFWPLQGNSFSSFSSSVHGKRCDPVVCWILFIPARVQRRCKAVIRIHYKCFSQCLPLGNDEVTGMSRGHLMRPMIQPWKKTFRQSAFHQNKIKQISQADLLIHKHLVRLVASRSETNFQCSP